MAIVDESACWVSDVHAAPAASTEIQGLARTDFLEALSIKASIVPRSNKGNSAHLTTLLLPNGQEIVAEKAFELGANMCGRRLQDSKNVFGLLRSKVCQQNLFGT